MEDLIFLLPLNALFFVILSWISIILEFRKKEDSKIFYISSLIAAILLLIAILLLNYFILIKIF